MMSSSRPETFKFVLDSALAAAAGHGRGRKEVLVIEFLRNRTRRVRHNTCYWHPHSIRDNIYHNMDRWERALVL